MLVPANFTDGAPTWVNLAAVNFLREQADATFIEYGGVSKPHSAEGHDRVVQTPASLLAAAGLRWPAFPSARHGSIWINPERVLRMGVGRHGDTFVNFGGTFEIVVMPLELVAAALNESGWGRPKAVA